MHLCNIITSCSLYSVMSCGGRIMKMNKLLRTRGQHHFVELNSQARILTHSVEQTLICWCVCVCGVGGVGWSLSVFRCLGTSDVYFGFLFTQQPYNPLILFTNTGQRHSHNKSEFALNPMLRQNAEWCFFKTDSRGALFQLVLVRGASPSGCYYNLN